MTPRDLENIHTTGNSCRDTFPCATWHWSIPVFLPADGEAFWSLYPSSVSLLSGGTMQPENTYSCIIKVTDQVWENQKRISININHSYHQRHLLTLVSTDLTIKSDLVLTTPIGNMISLTVTAQKMKFSLRISIQFSENLVTFTEEVHNGKPHFLCSVWEIYCLHVLILIHPTESCKRSNFHDSASKR